MKFTVSTGEEGFTFQLSQAGVIYMPGLAQQLEDEGDMLEGKGILGILEGLIDCFEEWDNGHAGKKAIGIYTNCIYILDYLNTEPEPINGRYIDAEDRWAIFCAMEHLHAEMIGIECTLHATGYETYRKLIGLKERLAQN